MSPVASDTIVSGALVQDLVRSSYPSSAAGEMLPQLPVAQGFRLSDLVQHPAYLFGDDLRTLIVGMQLVGEVLVTELRGDIDQRDLVLQAVSLEPVIMEVTIGVQVLGD